MDGWVIFVLGVITFQILKMLYMATEQYLKERREKRLLKMVQVGFPGNEKITFITIDANDKHAMAKLEREVRSHYDIEDEIGDSMIVDPFSRTKEKS